LPIFQGGRLSANLKRARAAYDESVANYRQQVLVAFQEVEDALAGLRILEDQAAAQARAVQAAQRTRRISTFRYKQGAALYLEVLDAQRSVLLNEQLAAEIRGLQLVTSVQLVKARGEVGKIRTSILRVNEFRIGPGTWIFLTYLSRWVERI